MQCAACAAARCHAEVGFACCQALLLVGACHGVLEAGGVGRVAGDRHVDALFPHDGYALAHVVGAIAFHLGTLAVAVGSLLHHLELAGEVVKLGAHIGETVDAAYDLGGILAQAVQYHAQGLFAHLVGSAGNLDGTLGSGKRLVAGQEGKALGLVAQQACSQVAVAQNAEGLQAQANGLGSVGSVLAAFLERDSCAHHIGPLGVLKAYLLGLFASLIRIDTILVADGVGLFHVFDACGIECSEHLLLATVL